MSAIDTAGGSASQPPQRRSLSDKSSTLTHNDVPLFRLAFRDAVRGTGAGDIAPVVLEHFDPIPPRMTVGGPASRSLTAVPLSCMHASGPSPAVAWSHEQGRRGVG